MFTVNCPVEGGEVLRGPRSILSMHNTSQGVVSYVRCACGATVVMVSGQYATEPRVHHPAADLEAVVGAPVTVGAA